MGLDDKFKEEKAEMKSKGFGGWLKDNWYYPVGLLVVLVVLGAMFGGGAA